MTLGVTNLLVNTNLIGKFGEQNVCVTVNGNIKIKIKSSLIDES